MGTPPRVRGRRQQAAMINAGITGVDKGWNASKGAVPDYTVSMQAGVHEHAVETRNRARGSRRG